MLQVSSPCHKNGIVGCGNPNAKVMFVGTSPAKYERYPFTGRPGQILDCCLNSINMTRNDVFLSNLYCHFAETYDLPTEGACAKRLLQEISLVKPKIIVTFGDKATEFLLQKSLKKWRGSVIWDPIFQCFTIPTYQPASVFASNGATIHDIVRDIDKIPDVLTWDQYHSDVDYEIVNDSRLAQALLNDLPADTVAIDIETTGKDVDEFDVYIDKLVCLSVATKDKAWVFPASICNNLMWPTHPKYTFHNGIFDVGGLMKYLGVHLNISDDTMLMSYALDERKGRHSLKNLSREYCGADFYEEGVKVGRAINSKDDTEINKLYNYNAKDGCYTARLSPILLDKARKDNVSSVYTELLVPAANAFAEIQYRGAHVDNSKIRELSMKWFPQWIESEKNLIAYANELGYPGEINLNSPKQLSHLLFDILQLPGGPSTRKEILEQLEEFHPFVTRFMKFRRLDHIIGSYILGIQDDIKSDSRVHAQVLLHGTSTGRLSYHKPPLQTIPKPRSDEDQDFLELREMFNTTNDNYCIVETDYEKAEVWGAYALSQDQHLLEDLNSIDFHRRVASVVYKTPFDDITERQRFNSKRTTFGIIYGITDRALAKLIKTSVDEASEIIQNWYSRYDKYFEWFNRTKEELFREGEIVGPTGRKRRFKIFVGAYQDKINQAVNFPIQSLASDVTLASTIKLHHLLKEFDSYILWCVHDSIIFEVRKKYLKEVLSLIKNTMSAIHFEGIPGIPVEIKVGSRLSDTHKIKDY